MRYLASGLVGLLLSGCVASSSVPVNSPVRLANQDQFLPVNDSRIFCAPITAPERRAVISALCVNYATADGKQVDVCDLGHSLYPFDGIPEIVVDPEGKVGTKDTITLDQVKEYEVRSSALLKQAAGTYFRKLDEMVREDKDITLKQRIDETVVSFKDEGVNYYLSFNNHGLVTSFIITPSEVIPNFKSGVEIYVQCMTSPLLGDLDNLVYRVKETLKIKFF